MIGSLVAWLNQATILTNGNSVILSKKYALKDIKSPYQWRGRQEKQEDYKRLVYFPQRLYRSF